MPSDEKLKRAVKVVVDDFIAKKTQEAEAATTFEEALDGMRFFAPIRRELFTGHREFYVLLLDGAYYIRDSDCWIHGNHRVMWLYTTRADVDMYMTSYEPTLIPTRPSTRLDGEQVLALAAAAGAEVFDINWLGASPTHHGRIRVDTLAQCQAQR